MAEQEQLALLKQGFWVWDDWRLKNPTVKVNLAYADLRGADLRGADLRGADLRGADLIGTDLRGADLSYASLRGADLRGADLRGADLRGADLRGADLSYANLKSADLRGADLSYAKLSDAKLSDAIVINTKFGSLVSNIVESAAPDVVDLPGGPPAHSGAGFFKPTCYVHAEMDDLVIIHHATTLEVVVSKEKLDKAISTASQGGQAEIDSDECLIVQVIPKLNFITVETDRVEVDSPKKGNPHHILFDLRATHIGEGEVWVVLRQRQLSLLSRP